MSIKTNKFRRMKSWMHASVLSLFLVVSAFSSSAQDGEKLYKANCASCHKLDAKLIGPALSGVEDRWESRENLIEWIKNSQDYLKNHPEDSYAAGLFEEYNKSIMPAMALTNEEVESILSYIANPPVAEVPVEAPAPAGAPAEDYTMYWLLGFAVVMLVITKVLLDVKKSLKSLLTEVRSEELNELGELDDTDWTSGQKLAYWTANHKKSVIMLLVLGNVVLLAFVWHFIFGIGVYGGGEYGNYAPEQPIKFSHKIHAGDNGVNCVYCHSSAEKSKHSGIPSANVCMNCHKGINEGSLYGEEEIAKIYEAVGWDPAEQAYTKPEKPIKWIRIHNLPDHVYFNHSQHVVVGEIECQTCHGEVETYDYPMQQYAELTMGWCINCHRDTEVKMAGNAYYEKLHAELVEKYKHEGIEKFTVKNIGGIECAKCHY